MSLKPGYTTLGLGLPIFKHESNGCMVLQLFKTLPLRLHFQTELLNVQNGFTLKLFQSIYFPQNI